MAKLWKKSDTSYNPAVEAYTAGTDHVFDRELLPFDITASIAHAQGLEKIGLLSTEELKQILTAFDALKKDFAEGNIEILPEDEDCHTVIENYLVEKLGDAGKKIHTGRSRNDQVLVALRLYMKAHLAQVHELTVSLAKQFLSHAQTYEQVPMPGYTHTQQAMLSSVGHYMAAFSESLLDDAVFIRKVFSHIDKNPLGSAAGFGVSIPLDRALTTKALGFADIQVNSLYVQNSRGKFESVYMEALSQVMQTVGRFANDLILFTSREFDFFSVDDSLVTGSSIMPQKRNLDVCEIARGNVSVVLANQFMIKEISKNLLSGYNRDLQLIKKPLFESTHIVETTLKVASLILPGITPNAAQMEEKITHEIFAADVANDLVKKEGLPFRDAYKKAMDLLASYKPDFKKNLQSKVSLGAPGNLNLKALQESLDAESKSDFHS